MSGLENLVGSEPPRLETLHVEPYPRDSSEGFFAQAPHGFKSI